MLDIWKAMQNTITGFQLPSIEKGQWIQLNLYFFTAVMQFSAWLWGIEFTFVFDIGV